LECAHPCEEIGSLFLSDPDLVVIEKIDYIVWAHEVLTPGNDVEEPLDIGFRNKALEVSLAFLQTLHGLNNRPE
jgi:hypothetical protein